MNTTRLRHGHVARDETELDRETDRSCNGSPGPALQHPDQVENGRMNCDLEYAWRSWARCPRLLPARWPPSRPHEARVAVMALALAIFLVVLFTQVVSWVGKSVLQEAVRTFPRSVHDATDHTLQGMHSVPQHCPPRDDGQTAAAQSRYFDDQV